MSTEGVEVMGGGDDERRPEVPINRQTAMTQRAYREIAQMQRPSRAAAKTCERSQKATTTHLEEPDAR